MGRCHAGGAWMPDGWGPLAAPGATLGACLSHKSDLSLSSATGDAVVIAWRTLTQVKSANWNQKGYLENLRKQLQASMICTMYMKCTEFAVFILSISLMHAHDLQVSEPLCVFDAFRAELLLIDPDTLSTRPKATAESIQPQKLPATQAGWVCHVWIQSPQVTAVHVTTVSPRHKRSWRLYNQDALTTDPVLHKVVGGTGVNAPSQGSYLGP